MLNEKLITLVWKSSEQFSNFLGWQRLVRDLRWHWSTKRREEPSTQSIIYWTQWQKQAWLQWPQNKHTQTGAQGEREEEGVGRERGLERERQWGRHKSGEMERLFLKSSSEDFSNFLRISQSILPTVLPAYLPTHRPTYLPSYLAT